jgi:hypothetical protein
MNKEKYNQYGLVSIMVASVLMIIMALITLGFTRVVQREQRQAVDAQLSRQAFYAAETGINVAIDSSLGSGFSDKTTCDVSGAPFNDGVVASSSLTAPLTSEEQSSADLVEFTCILIQQNSSDFVFDNDSITSSPQTVPVKPVSPITSIVFEWRDNNTNNVQASCNAGTLANLDFEGNAAGWGNKIGALKLDLIGLPNSSPFGREDLVARQFGAVLYPCNSATGLSSVTFASSVGNGSYGRIIPVNCQNSGDYECRLEITGLNSFGPGLNRQEMYARFNSIYKDLDLRIEPLANGSRVQLEDAQAIVDSTGKANDVLRRLQARVPLYNAYILPQAVLQSQEDVCKLYQVEVSRVVDNCN